MWFFTAWLSLALCWALAPPAAAKRASKPALPDFTGKYASDGILTFTDRNYTSIVLKAAVSLPDTFVVLYTAADPRFKCSVRGIHFRTQPHALLQCPAHLHMTSSRIRPIRRPAAEHALPWPALPCPPLLPARLTGFTLP